MAVNHYENFPVASWLCPPALRPTIAAIYRFARTADDIADEGPACEAERRARLDAYAAELDRLATGAPATTAWPDVFVPLAAATRRHDLPLPLLRDLLSAFRQDTANPLYPDRAALLDYCARSANPIGRLLLHLVGVVDRAALDQSDAVCSALQLINFWQDLSVDLPRGRCYLPVADAARHGIDPRSLRVDSAASRALVAELVQWSRALMQQGAPLVHRLQGRFGWELRLVVQGGLRVLDKIEAGGFNALSQRPTVGARDAPLLAWRALVMRRGGAAATAAPAHP
ncbi:MAG TPA: squalene synthase HpnC [Burkholderiaceae bacterium]|nr:squalene synthase HpnC [Burkholderiaceae bacterium]